MQKWLRGTAMPNVTSSHPECVCAVYCSTLSSSIDNNQSQCERAGLSAYPTWARLCGVATPLAF